MSYELVMAEQAMHGALSSYLHHLRVANSRRVTEPLGTDPHCECIPGALDPRDKIVEPKISMGLEPNVYGTLGAATRFKVYIRVSPGKAAR